MLTTTTAARPCWPQSPYNKEREENDEDDGEGGTDEEERGTESSCDADCFSYVPRLLGVDTEENLDTDEMYKIMRLKEREAPRKLFTQDYVDCRSVLVEWVTQTGESALNLTPLTIHLAVAYLDSAMASLHNKTVNRSRLQLMATACILTAAKFEEVDGKVPSVHDLNHCCGGGYSPALICKMESLLLNILDWRLIILTPRHFLELYLSKGATAVHIYEEFIDNNTIPQHKVAVVQRYQRKYAEFFTDLCLQDHSFAEYWPSIVACASIACGRKQLRVEPIWPTHLQELTQYEFAQFSGCFHHLWRVYEQNFVLSDHPS